MPFPYLLPILFGSAEAEQRIVDSILASGLQNSEHIKAFDIVGRDRLALLDLNPLLIYMIDTVPAVALPHLAAQFDILGYKGWRFAKTEAEQRSLIKQAIELHRFKGTPWSIKEAIKRAGYSDATIIEGIGQYHDGSFIRDGSITHSGLSNWACFRVIFNLGNDKGISEQETIDITALVNEYKNVRSKLVNISFVKSIEDEVIITETVQITIQMDMDEDFQLFHNGKALRNGLYKRNAYVEDVTISQ